MALRIATILLICGAGYVLAQYNEEAGGGVSTPPKKLLQISGTRRIKSPRLASPLPQTTIINQKFRRPIHRPRLAAEPIPELPVFTSGIRGSRPSSASTINVEQNDEASALPIQAIQQPQVHQQLQHEVKPVNEDNEKDQNIVQVIANLGAVASNLVTPATATPTVTSGVSASYLHQQLQQQHQQHQQHHQQQQQLQQQQQQQSVQYRPVQQVSRSSLNSLPETQALQQVIAPVQYRPQKPARLHKHQQQQQQQQQLVERNEYDINEARPFKQRAQTAPKKSRPNEDYYEGRTKKPVAQVIRRYREETADGSIIWGFENDDGSFKEEIIGIDCITRGKYGYVDPDGLRREYTYETGIRCDEEAQQQQDQDILNTFVDYQENKLVLPSGKTIDLSSMGKKQARRPQLYRN